MDTLNTANPFIDRFRDRMLSFPELFDEYRLRNYLIQMPNRGNKQMNLVAFTMIFAFTAVFLVTLLFSSLSHAFGWGCVTLLTVPLLVGALQEQGVKFRKYKWIEFEKTFSKDDYEWIAKTLRDYHERPEYDGLYQNNDPSLDRLRRFIKHTTFEFAIRALSEDPRIRLDALKYVITPLTRHQIEMSREGKFISTYNYCARQNFSIDLVDQLNGVQRSREKMILKKDSNDRLAATEELLYSL